MLIILIIVSIPTTKATGGNVRLLPVSIIHLPPKLCPNDFDCALGSIDANARALTTRLGIASYLPIDLVGMKHSGSST